MKNKTKKKPAKLIAWRVTLAHDVTFYSEHKVRAESRVQARRMAAAETVEELGWNTSSQGVPRVLGCVEL